MLRLPKLDWTTEPGVEHQHIIDVYADSLYAAPACSGVRYFGLAR